MSRGVKFVNGEATELLFASGKKDVKGARLNDGQEMRADLVVLASGAWTSALLPECGQDLLPTGQVVGTIQMSKEEADRYRNVPVSRDRVNAYTQF